MNDGRPRYFEFGEFRLDSLTRVLRKRGEVVPLTFKVCELLLVLVQNPGRVLSKEELMSTLWPDTIVEEGNLKTSISVLRKALGDRKGASDYIQTLPKLGYQFIAPVIVLPEDGATLVVEKHVSSAIVIDELRDEEDEDDALSVSAREPDAIGPRGRSYTRESARRLMPGQPLDTGAPGRWRRTMFVAIALAAVGLMGAGVAVWLQRRTVSQQSTIPGNRIQSTILTRTGTIIRGALSPDGRHAAYAITEAGRQSLWLRQVAMSSNRQIAAPADVRYNGLIFSRDGDHVYFVREEVNSTERALYRMPALGGTPAKLLVDLDGGICLSPDGTRIAFTRNHGGASTLMIADSEGGNHQTLATRPSASPFKVPAWSPNGQVIACSVGHAETTEALNTVVGVRVEDGMQEPLTTHTWTWVRWVEWLSDETGILITARQGILDPDQVWHISRPAGEVRKLTNDLKAFYSISLSADSRSLLAIQTELRSEILYAPVSDGSRARQITFGVGAYAEVCHGTDDRILYSSQAGGNWDLWSMNTDGSDQRQLTVDAGYNSDVTVSPDGRYIYFSSSRQGALNVWRSNIDGSNAVRVTTGDGERWPRCSPDGKWLLFNSVGPSDDLYAIWKMPVEGGEPVLLAEGWSARPAISPDGRLVASFKLVDGTNRYQLTISPFEGGAPYRVIDLPNDFVVMPYVQWLPDGRSLSYAVTRKGSSNIWIQPLDKGEPKQLTEFTTGGNLLFDWSRDGKHLVIARRNWAPDLVLLSGFL